jgi:hypothetical protein
VPDYIPNKEPEKILWLWNLMRWLLIGGAANAFAHGFTLDEACKFYTTVFQAKLAADNNVTKQAAARAATVAKNKALAKAIGMARDYAQRLQNDPSMTNADRAAAGLTIPDTIPTTVAVDEIMTIPPPLLLLDFSVRRQVTVHWGPNPSNERENGRPAGTIGCQVQTARGGIPAEESAWVALEIDTESPIIHLVNETAPTVYAYRARYVGKSLKLGAFGFPVVCTVNV